MTTINRISRLEWLHDEIRIVDGLIEHSGPIVRPVSLAASQLHSLRTQRRDLQAELDELTSGGRIDLRLTGAAVHEHSIRLDALAEVVQPVRRLVDALGSAAFVTSRPGSFVLEITASPQQQLDGVDQRIESVGEVLADLIDAGLSADVDEAVERVVDDLSLEVVRAATALVGGLRSQKLNLDLSWTNAAGRIRSGRLGLDRSADVQQALRRTEEERSSYEVRGELRGITLEGRRTFQIRRHDGTVVVGLIARDVLHSLLGFSIGEQVLAQVEETQRTKFGSHTAASKRLTGLKRIAV
jgi:hypothetical protein